MRSTSRAPWYQCDLAGFFMAVFDLHNVVFVATVAVLAP